MGASIKCRECNNSKIVGAAKLNIGTVKGGSMLCISCVEKLQAKESAPPGIRDFVCWYRDNKIEVDPSAVIRKQKARIAELEQLLRLAALDK